MPVRELKNAGENPPPLLNGDFLLVTLLGCLYFFIFHSFLLLPIRISELGETEKTVGFVMGVAGLSTLVLTPWVGRLTDRYGKKPFMLLGFLLLALSTFPFGLLDRVGYPYYVLRVVHGCSFSLFFVAAGALAVDVSAEERRTQALGIYGVFTIINYAAAPYVGSLLMRDFGFDFLVFLLAAAALAGAGVCLFLGGEKRGPESPAAERSYLECLRDGPTLVCAVTLFVCGAAFVTTFNFVSLFSLSAGVESFHLYFLSYTLSVLAVRLFLGWVPDRYGKRRVAAPCVLLLGLGVLGLSLVHDARALVVCAAVFGFAHGFVYPSVYSMIIDSNPAGARARAFALSSVSFTGGGMAGSFVFGVVADFFGFRTMFVAVALMVFAGFAFFSASPVLREKAG